MLELQSVDVHYGAAQALYGVSIAIPHGGIVALLGPNGAGKTTVLRTISGLLTPRQGAVVFEGRPLAGIPAEEVTRMGIIHVPEGRGILPQFTVEENFRIGAYLRKDTAQVGADIQQILDYFPILGKRWHQVAATLSGGEQQMLAIGRALLSRPRLLLVDEPSFGLAPLIMKEVMKILQRINQQGVTVLLVEQNVRLALAISDFAYVLEGGRIAASGEAKALATSDLIKRSYLGQRRVE